MTYGLGIDTGGTYTDAVIYDFEQSAVACTAKSITIKEDLKIGINDAIGQLDPVLLAKVSLVSLSTTLATNACVEGKGSRAKLVMIGCDRIVVERYGDEYGLPSPEEIIFLDGGHNLKGEVMKEPDWDFLKAAVMACMREVDVFAVVELWGVRDNEFERKAQDMILNWTGMQTVCGYELTGEINSLKRSASAMLNAQLIPIINDFLNAVKISLEQKDILAPLVIVRGDGSLMSEDFARGKPVETLLCGPAASVAGGIGLTGEKNCIIIDMGGTTSDIAIVKGGVPKLTMEDSNIGKWKTGMKSILINTVGLGGDSLIRHNDHGNLDIGPVRAAPLSWAAAKWPQLLPQMKILFHGNKKHTISLCEFFYLVRDITEDPFYNKEEKAIANALKSGPLSVTKLAKVTESSIYDLKTKRLEQYGAIMRCGLTPTDIMHLTGAFTGWEKDAAVFGASIMARQIDLTLEELIALVNRKVKEKLYYHIVQMLLEDEDPNLTRGGVSKQLDYLVSTCFKNRIHPCAESKEKPDFLRYAFTTDAVLVGIGAPIHIYLPDVARVLGTTASIPENAAVANAIGAITGNVMVEESILIRPVYSPSGITGYLGFSTHGKMKFSNHASALEWAKVKARELAVDSSKARGAFQYEISIHVHNDSVDVSGVSEIRPPATTAEDEFLNSEGALQLPDSDIDSMVKSGNALFLESVVTARAIGKIMPGLD
jgi:N-methylhydantoinase A/oxoprolinase/acetone carboxylase beta subunit